MKKMIPILIIIAGLVPAILALIQYYQNVSKEKEAKSNELQLTAKIDSLNFCKFILTLLQ